MSYAEQPKPRDAAVAVGLALTGLVALGSTSCAGSPSAPSALPADAAARPSIAAVETPVAVEDPPISATLPPPLPAPPLDATCIVRGEGTAMLHALDGDAVTVGVYGSVTAYLVPGALTDVFVTVDLGGVEVAGMVAAQSLVLSTHNEVVVDGYGLLRGALSGLHGDAVTVSVDDGGVVLEPRWNVFTQGKVQGRNSAATEHVACSALRWGLDEAALTLPMHLLGTASGRGTKPIELSNDPGGPTVVDVDPSVVSGAAILQEQGSSIRVYIGLGRPNAPEWGVVGWAKKRRFATWFIRDIPKPSQAELELNSNMLNALAGPPGPPGTLSSGEISPHTIFECSRAVAVWGESPDGRALLGSSTPGAKLYVYDSTGSFAPVETAAGSGLTPLRVLKTDLEQCQRSAPTRNTGRHRP